jgi:all-trans-retinol 13,14-reductase
MRRSTGTFLWIVIPTWLALIGGGLAIYLPFRSHASLIGPVALLLLGALMTLVVRSYVAPFWTDINEHRDYDWKVDVVPGQSKAEDEYDVIVVGSGLGGLFVAALLACDALKVLVCEQHRVVGGCCTAFRRKGFTFNVAIQDVAGFWYPKGAMPFLMQRTGLRQSDLFVRNSARYVFEGGHVDVPNDHGPALGAFIERFPHEADNLERFFEDVRIAYEDLFRETGTFDIPIPAPVLLKAYRFRDLPRYFRGKRKLTRWGLNTSLRRKLAGYFRDPNLRDIFAALVGYTGTRPENTLAVKSLSTVLSYVVFGGGWSFKGGSQRFADALRDVITTHGGEVLVDRRVDRILVEKGRVTGVQTGGKRLTSSLVVSNADVSSTMTRLVDASEVDASYMKRLKELELSHGATAVYLGLDMDLSEYPILIRDVRTKLEVAINSNADPGLAPPGQGSVTLIVPDEYHRYPPRGTSGYLEAKRRATDEIIGMADRIIPGLRDHIVVAETGTPRTFERYLSMPAGACYSFSQALNNRRPYFKAPIRGLYFSGASTHPGAGVEGVAISAIICYKDITRAW